MGQMTTLEKLGVAEELLDRLVDARGREKCRIVATMGDLINLLRNDILILEDKVKLLEEKNAQEIKMEAASKGE